MLRQQQAATRTEIDEVEKLLVKAPANKHQETGGRGARETELRAAGWQFRHPQSEVGEDLHCRSQEAGGKGVKEQVAVLRLVRGRAPPRQFFSIRETHCII
jgi:hypothetical protein